MTWSPPENYEEKENLDSSLRNNPNPRVGTAEFKMVNLVVHSTTPAEIGLTQRQARKAIDDRLVPEDHYPAVLDIALGRPPQPHGGAPALANSFRFAFPDLAAWNPGGSSDEENLDRIHALARASFEPQDALEDSVFDNPDVPAGYTYLGQFIDHDITRDARPLAGGPSNPDTPATSVRTLVLELDSVYGPTPGEGELFEGDKRFKIGRGFGDGEADLPRRHDDDPKSFEFNPAMIQPNAALIGDNRNDENLLVAQVHLAFLKFHNAEMDDGASFEDARTSTIRHYQWVVLHDFMKRVCGADLVDRLLEEPDSRRMGFPGGELFMPLEFAVAAFRFGHTMVRPDYELNDVLTDLAGPIDIFSTRNMPLSGLRGGRRLPAIWTLQMDRFFDFDGHAPAQRSRRMDTKLAPPLVELPEFMGIEDARMRSLAFRNLRRAWQNGLPTGQTLAQQMGLPVMNRGAQTPLWLYVLQEANAYAGGRHLGPLGGHLVAETMIGLLEAGKTSILRSKWTPQNRDFTFPDFLQKAEMPVGPGDLPFSTPGADGAAVA
jgi:hypothetical protein